MNKINCTLVGFRHHAWRGMTLGNRIAHAQGRPVMLMRDSENHRNSNAAVACIDSEVVAYVSNDECHRIGSYIDTTQYGLLYGHITSVDASQYRCTAQIEVDRTIEETPATADTGFAQWDADYSHIPTARLTDEELRLHMLQRHLLTQFSCQHEVSDLLVNDIELYITMTRYDISAEATQARRAITQLLLSSYLETLRRYGQRMEAAITAMGNNDVCADIARHLTHLYAQSSAITEMMRHHGAIERSALEQALMAMPHSLHSEYRLSVADFVSRAYYLQIPRRVLRRFICGELLLYHTTKAIAQGSMNSEIISAAKEYINRISTHLTTAWQDRATALWHEILQHFAPRIVKLNGVKDSAFNARFICQVVGRLIDLGVYDDTISQAEYGRTLALNGKDMRSSINRGLIDDTDARCAISQMVDKYRHGKV